jgi:ribosome-associated protein
MSEKPSRSELKRAFKRIEEAAAVLAELSNSDLQKFSGSQEIRDEIIACRGLKGGARKRQIKYLAKVMRQEPLDDIYTFLAEIKGLDLKEKEVFHQAERLRDAIINEAMEEHRQCLQMQIPWEPVWESALIEQVAREYFGLNKNELRKSVFQFVTSRNKVHYREVFRMLKAAMDQEEVRKKAL